MWVGKGLRSTEVAYLLLSQQPRVQFSVSPRIFLLMLLRFIDGTAYNSGQRHDNVNPTHLVLASGNLVLQNGTVKFYGTGPSCLQRLATIFFTPIDPSLLMLILISSTKLFKFFFHNHHFILSSVH